MRGHSRGESLWNLGAGWRGRTAEQPPHRSQCTRPLPIRIGLSTSGPRTFHPFRHGIRDLRFVLRLHDLTRLTRRLLLRAAFRLTVANSVGLLQLPGVGVGEAVSRRTEALPAILLVRQRSAGLNHQAHRTLGFRQAVAVPVRLSAFPRQRGNSDEGSYAQCRAKESPESAPPIPGFDVRGTGFQASPPRTRQNPCVYRHLRL